jgi:hypothetical protein
MTKLEDLKLVMKIVKKIIYMTNQCLQIAMNYIQGWLTLKANKK